jgi:Na+-driven multidrug efflux pump/anti-sigma regulatory factor (Ser/Thr protein kinase)
VLPAQIFLLLLTGINNMVDGLVGTNFLGAEAMSTIGLYSPFQLIWVATGTVLVVSSQVLCARYMGAGDLEKTKGVFSLNLTLALGLTVLATILSFAISPTIARILGASPDTLGDLSGYIMGRGVGLIPMVLGSQFVAFLSLEGQDKRNYIATGTMLVANVVLDILFAAVIKMGIPGLGVATSLSQWLNMIVAASFFLTPKASLKYSFKSIRWKEVGGMLKIGFPSAMVFFLTSIRSGLFNNLLADYDPTMISVAAMSTYAIAIMIFESVGKGVAAAGRLTTSVSYGEEDGRSITAIMKTVFTKGLLIALAASAVTFLLSNFVAGLFYSDSSSEVYKLTAMALRFGAVVLILETISAIFSNYFQSIGRTVIVNVMSVLEGIAAMLPAGLLLIPRLGVTGSMITFIVGYSIVALCGPIYAIIYWKRIPESLSEWVTIPEDFGAADDERFDASIHSLEEAVSISKEVQNFCRGRNIDEKKAYCSALALEELCLGIIKDRFGADKKKHTIEVRIVHKECGDVLMSIKDDCKPYNPKDREKFLNPNDDSPKSISIRLFMGIIKSTEYQLTLGINVFTVTI